MSLNANLERGVEFGHMPKMEVDGIQMYEHRGINDDIWYFHAKSIENYSQTVINHEIPIGVQFQISTSTNGSGLVPWVNINVDPSFRVVPEFINFSLYGKPSEKTLVTKKEIVAEFRRRSPLIIGYLTSLIFKSRAIDVKRAHRECAIRFVAIPNVIENLEILVKDSRPSICMFGIPDVILTDLDKKGIREMMQVYKNNSEFLIPKPLSNREILLDNLSPY